MKTTKQLLFIGLAITLVLASCTMEKRVYMSGYHTEWLNGKRDPGKNELANKNNSKKSDANETVIVTNDQTEQSTINSNITDETLTASTDNSIFVPSTHKMEFHKNKNKTVVNENAATSETKTIIKADSQQNKKVNKKNANGGGKSQLVALLLCIFIGALGIHRFYLGYIGIGVIQLLTLGCCGIWSLIDLIRIITGDLKPKDGDYDETL